MIEPAKLRNQTWADVVTICSFRKQCLNSVNDVTPIEKCFKMKPHLDPLRVFECLAYAHTPKYER